MGLQVTLLAERKIRNVEREYPRKDCLVTTLSSHARPNADAVPDDERATQSPKKPRPQQCRLILQQSTANDFFRQGAEAYLQENLLRLSEDTCRLCCSDSIESLFGKYKNQLRQATGQVITDACLTIANLTAKPQHEEIKQAMERTKMVDLQQWKKENLPKSLLQKRRELFKSVG